MVHPFPTLPHASYLQAKEAPGVLRLCCPSLNALFPLPGVSLPILLATRMLLPPLGLLSWVPAFTLVCLSCLLCDSWNTCCPFLTLPALGCPCGLVPGHPSPLRGTCNSRRVKSAVKPSPIHHQSKNLTRAGRGDILTMGIC